MITLSSTLNNLLHYIGLLTVIYVVIKLLITLYYLISVYLVPRLKKQDYKQYGQWAVITGSTDGIGKGFAEELAGKGVDICLISRNEVRLQNTAQQLETKYGVKTRYIVADFTDPNIYDHIEKNLEGLDIGILVNNVGIIAENLEPFTIQSRQLHKDTLNVNLFSIVMMTSLIAPAMVTKKCGLIINMSSIGGELIIPFFSTYAGCKNFITAFGRSLSEELKYHNVQMTTLQPSFTRTKMLSTFPFIDPWLSYLPFFVINVKQLIENALITISAGRFLICGYFPHEFYLAVLKRVPNFIVTPFIKFLMSKNSERI